MVEFGAQIFYWESKMQVNESLTEAMKTLEGERHISPIAESILKEESTRLTIQNDNGSGITMTGEGSVTINEPDSTAYTISPGSYIGASTTTITESAAETESSHIFISGEAIHAGTTRNMNHYLGSELAKATPSLVGKSIQLDHSHKSLDNVGKVIAASFDQNTGTLKYVGRLQKGEKVTEKVRVGDLDTVSIGAHAKDIVCGICGISRVMRSKARRRGCKHAPGSSYDGVIATNVGIGIDFVELSLTPVPADPRASAMAVTHDSMESALFALAESFQYGDENKVSEEQTPDPEMIEALRAEKSQLEAELADSRLKDKSRVANGIAGAEIRLGLLKESERTQRLSDLTSQPIEALELLSKSLDMRLEHIEREAPKSKGIITESESQDDGVPSYNELKAFFRRRIFNWDAPSAAAVSKVQELAMNPLSEIHPAYIQFLGLGGNQE